ncbi:MAG: DUF6291 domain-containing protein [Bacteroidales bacterium]|nr:DUF6291 domain-containing protein [Bacteroidales bacterium]MCF8337177.1 DUF6291 domain-containing protein [Bacteroidales bacterium]
MKDNTDKDKQSFLLYKNFYSPIKGLSNEQLGRLFRAIFEYQINGIEEVDSDINMALQFFIVQFKLDDEKYQKIVDRNRENGQKGGRPKEPSGISGNPKNPVEPKKADNENVNENVNENEYDYENKKSQKNSETKTSLKDRNKKYSPYAKELAEIIQTKKNFKPSTNQLQSWTDEIRKLSEINQVSTDRIKKALDWYAENIGGEYVVEIESGKALREKFTKLEKAVNKNEKASKAGFVINKKTEASN